jgi:phosphinothricin acetyltransferase
MIDWFHEHSGQKFPMIIAKEGEEVLGWTLIKPYRKDRAVFDTTVEISYFIHNSHHKKGIGFQLVNEMQKMASQIGYRTIIAIVMSENLGSIRLMEKCDFSLWGEMPKVGLVDGVEIDHLYFGKHLIQK